MAFEANISGNQVNMHLSGKHYIECNDGVKYKITFPIYFINGVITGRRYMNYSGSLIIEDLVNIRNNFRQMG